MNFANTKLLALWVVNEQNQIVVSKKFTQGIGLHRRRHHDDIIKSREGQNQQNNTKQSSMKGIPSTPDTRYATYIPKDSHFQSYYQCFQREYLIKRQHFDNLNDYFMIFSMPVESSHNQNGHTHQQTSSMISLLWPMISLVIGGVSFIALPYFDQDQLFGNDKVSSNHQEHHHHHHHHHHHFRYHHNVYQQQQQQQEKQYEKQQESIASSQIKQQVHHDQLLDNEIQWRKFFKTLKASLKSSDSRTNMWYERDNVIIWDWFHNHSLNHIPFIDVPCVTGTLTVLQDLAGIYFSYETMKPILTNPTDGTNATHNTQAIQQQQQQHPLSSSDIHVKNNITGYLLMYMSQSYPFGRPIDTSPLNVIQTLTKPFQNKNAILSKSPAWKSHSNLTALGKQRIQFTIRENIYSVQYDKKKKGIADVYHSFGSIICSSDLDGFPDVHFALSTLKSSPISHLSYHYCVTNPSSLTASLLSTSSSSSSSSMQDIPSSSGLKRVNSNLSLSSQTSIVQSPKKMPIQDQQQQQQEFCQHKITFNPPPGAFTLCKYRIHSTTSGRVMDGTANLSSGTSITSLPVRGFYQMKHLTSTSVQILVQLKLDENHGRNEFEYFDCIIPFSQSIKNFQVAPNVGQVILAAPSSDKKSSNTLIWRIGTKVKAEKLEMIMPGKIFFVPSQSKSQKSDSSTVLCSDPAQSLSSHTSLLPSFSHSISSIFSDNVKADYEEMYHETENNTHLKNNKADLNASMMSHNRMASISAAPSSQMETLADLPPDPFLKGNNCFIKLNYKMLNHSLSSIYIDPQSIATSPPSKIQAVLKKEVITVNCKIWNSRGDVQL